MRLPPNAALSLAVTAVLVLTSCASVKTSRLNPLNWFGGSQETQVAASVGTAAPDDRPLVEQVLTMEVEPIQQGAIVRATGLSSMQGYFDAELVALPLSDKGVLVYEFRIKPPPEPKPAGAQRTREVTVAATLSNFDLEDIREIVVQGASNARSSRR